MGELSKNKQRNVKVIKYSPIINEKFMSALSFQGTAEYPLSQKIAMVNPEGEYFFLGWNNFITIRNYYGLVSMIKRRGDKNPVKFLRNSNDINYEGDIAARIQPVIIDFDEKDEYINNKEYQPDKEYQNKKFIKVKEAEKYPVHLLSVWISGAHQYLDFNENDGKSEVEGVPFGKDNGETVINGAVARFEYLLKYQNLKLLTEMINMANTHFSDFGEFLEIGRRKAYLVM
jgi:hypothetical protein